MRSIWNGAISFGLVSIPIKLVNATENHSVSFRQIHEADGGRIRYRKVCELEEKEVTNAEIGKAYEDADGSMIPITDEDLASLPLPTAKTIEIVAFVPSSEIDPLQMDAAYYLSPNGVPAAKPYTLLREALKRSDKVAIAKFALRGRERLGMLRVVDDVVAMHGLLWPDEIRAPEGVAPQADVTVREAELDLADALMDTLGEVDIESLHDDYREAVEAMIAAKVEGGVTAETQAPAERAGGKVIDLMAALENSVRAAKEARGEEEVAEVTPIKGRAAPKPSGTKKSTGQAARKTAAKKAATKSTAKTAKKAASKSTTKSASKSTSKTASKSASPAESKPAAKKAASRRRSSA
ncbi:Ku protein [Streptomyces sp. ISL-10]|uniref:non-homologous end joining protein Ku n=1 Tax=Streptomyces sp. ISL-10 TaxID=2819172 RepID=UPI001BE9D646|nr:Ku protein [Streptomyces sp. ISL-10]MBT2365364.1 Ku protein [Streptomyces sp. ISL-10]